MRTLKLLKLPDFPGGQISHFQCQIDNATYQITLCIGCMAVGRRHTISMDI